MNYYILNEDGIPVPCDDLIKWATWLEEYHEARVVQQDTVGDFFISTVFLGLDYNWGDGPPILYETMVWHQGDYANDQERYTTRELALEGHRRRLVEYANGAEVRQAQAERPADDRLN